MKAQDFVVKLFLAGAEKKLLEERTYRHDGNDHDRTESFKVRLDKVGTQTLPASVEPVDKDAKETRTDNNIRPAEVNVADDKAKVLLDRRRGALGVPLPRHRPAARPPHEAGDASSSTSRGSTSR